MTIGGGVLKYFPPRHSCHVVVVFGVNACVVVVVSFRFSCEFLVMSAFAEIVVM